jgi:hypothetical protein
LKLNYANVFIPEVNFLMKELMFFVPEGERRFLVYIIQSTEGEGVSHVGLGYFILKMDNGQKVHGEGIYRRNKFASEINEDDLEAGAVGHPGKCKLMEENRSERLALAKYQTREADLASICWNSVLSRMERFGCFKCRFERIRLLGSMEMVMFVMVTGVVRVRKKAESDGMVQIKKFSGCLMNCEEEFITVGLEKELQFQESRLISNTSLISLSMKCEKEQPRRSLIMLSVFSSGFSKSNIFRLID